MSEKTLAKFKREWKQSKDFVVREKDDKREYSIVTHILNCEHGITYPFWCDSCKKKAKRIGWTADRSMLVIIGEVPDEQ